MTLEKAIKELEKEYAKAQKLAFVRNLLAYALYRIWKMVDSQTNEEQKEETDA